MRILKLTFLIATIFSFQGSHAQDKAKVYVIRATGFEGSATAYRVFIDKQLTCKLNNNKFSVHELAPGEHRFTVQVLGKTEYKKTEQPLNLTLKAGKTYYVELIYQTGVGILVKPKLFC